MVSRAAQFAQYLAYVFFLCDRAFTAVASHQVLDFRGPYACKYCVSVAVEGVSESAFRAEFFVCQPAIATKRIHASCDAARVTASIRMF